MGTFRLIHRDNGFEIQHDGQVVLAHSPEAPLLSAGRGTARIEMYRGNFQIEPQLIEKVGLSDWSVSEGQSGSQSWIFKFTKTGGWPLSLSVRGWTDTAGRDRLELCPRCTLSPINRFWLQLPAKASEHVYGCGEQFSHFDLKGRRFPLWTSEQGVGRNKSTYITWQADVQDKAGGDYWWTFFPQPTYVSSEHFFLHADSRAYAVFDFSDPARHDLEFWEVPTTITLGFGDSIKACVENLSSLLGRQPPLPAWIDNGVILGIQGGTQVCLDKLARVQKRGLPVAGIWAQDWEGKRITSFGKRLMWDWKWDSELYPGLDRTIPELRQQGVRFTGYINPYVAEGQSLCQEAAAQGYLAKNSQGQDYLVDFGEFNAGIVDFTIPAACEWYKNVIKNNLIEFGLSGWMADFGEYLPTDVVLADGTPATLAHNQWPAIWARINREAVDESGLKDEILYFMRAGYTGSQKWCGMAWAGDQNVDWSEDDGLPSVIPAALSLAMVGLGLHHSDIGGYTTLFGMKRTKELFMRWVEFAAFTPLMRSHEGNRPDDNWQFDSDDATIDHFAQLGKAFVALTPYRRFIMAENCTSGISMMRPLFFEFEHDPATWTLKDQYLFGPDLLVAPVIREGARSRTVYLPAGDWLHLPSNQVHHSPAGGSRPEIAAPLGQPPVFARTDSRWLNCFREAAQYLI